MAFIAPYTKLGPIRNFLELTVDGMYSSTDILITLIANAAATELNTKILNEGDVNLVWYNWSRYKTPHLDPNKEIIRTIGVMNGNTLNISRPGATNNPVISGIGAYLDEGDSNTAKNHNIAGDEYRLMLTFTKRSWDILDTGLYITGYTGYTGQSGTSTRKTSSVTSAASPSINTDNVDMYLLTAQAENIVSFTANLSGTPVDGQFLWIAITGTGSGSISWGTSFESSTLSLPTTFSTTRTDISFVRNTATNKWRIVAVV